MKLKKQQAGFSLIELLIVVVILGILAGISIPLLLKAKNAAQNSGAVATLRTVVTLQMSHMTAKGRYGRLDELNTISNNTLGTYNSPKLTRGIFTYEMNPLTPTDTDLKSNFTIFVRREGATGSDAYSLSVDASGVIVENPANLP